MKSFKRNNPPSLVRALSLQLLSSDIPTQIYTTATGSVKSKPDVASFHGFYDRLLVM